MERSTYYIRLFIATAGAVSSVLFVAGYSFFMAPIVRARSHLPLEQFPGLTQCFIHYSWFALVVPLSILILGIYLLRKQKIGAMFEALVGCQWLFALLWLACCLLVWLFPEVPNGDFIR
jgi:hypothetical protein